MATTDSQVRVSLEAEATDTEVAAVAAVFAEAGIDARVGVDPYCKGAGGEFPWMVAVSIPAGAFLTAFAAEAGKDAYTNLKGLIKRLYDARKASRFRTGSVTLLDTDTGTSVTLPPELSDEVWHQLFDVSRNELPSGVFRWVPTTGRWRDASDEG